MVSTTFKCFTCGAELKFNPTTQTWKCEFCDSEFQESDFADVIAMEEEQATAPAAPEKTQESEEGDIVTYQCSYCGAEVVTTSDTSATFCVFCQRPMILQNNLSGAFKPKYILPFQKTKTDALNTFRSYIKNKLFLPDEFKNNDHIEKITGVYVPFWLFGGTVRFDRSGEGDIVTSWSDSNYRYTKTDTYAYDRRGAISFEKIPVDASAKIDNDMMDSIEPFDYSELKEFATPYLSGFLAERFDESNDECATRAGERMVTSKDAQVNATIRYGITRTRNNGHTFSNFSSEYALLPVWLLYSRFQEKNYVFAMNGQTGKFLGNLPIDKKKVWKYGLLCFLGSGIVTTLVAVLSVLA